MENLVLFWKIFFTAVKRQMENSWKIAFIWGKSKNLVKSVKNRKIWWKFEKWKNFEKYFLPRWQMENSWKICFYLGKVEKSGKKCEK